MAEPTNNAGDFAVGERVRVSERLRMRHEREAYGGQEGEVEALMASGFASPILVRLPVGGRWFKAEELIRVTGEEEGS